MDRGDETGVWILDHTGAALDQEAVRDALRDLVQTTRSRGLGRSWAVIGELVSGMDEPTPDDGVSADPDRRAQDRRTEDRRAVDHDRVGRLAVRLAVDVVVSVGTGRASRALHQGAVMEGSWGDESRLAPDADAASAMLLAEVATGDVVLVVGGAHTDLSVVVRSLLDDVRCAARRVGQ